MSRADRLTAYDSQNAEAAAVILGDIEAHGGPDSGLVQWGELVARRAAPEASERQAGLFDSREVDHGAAA